MFDGLIYHRTKHTSVVTIWNPEHKQLFLQECHDNITSGQFSYDRTIERIKTTSWWPGYSKDTKDYCESCEICQKANKATGKRYGLLQEIEELKERWSVINMDFVTGLPPGGSQNFNAVLVVVDRFSKRAQFLACHKENTALDVALLFWNSIIYDVGCPDISLQTETPNSLLNFGETCMTYVALNLNFPQPTIPRQMF